MENKNEKSILNKRGYTSIIGEENKGFKERIIVSGKKGIGKTKQINELIQELNVKNKRVDFSSFNISDSQSLKREITGSNNFIKTLLLTITLVSLPLLSIMIPTLVKVNPNTLTLWVSIAVSIALFPPLLFIIYHIVLTFNFNRSPYIIFENMNRIKTESNVYSAIELIEKIPMLNYLKNKNIIFETEEDIHEIIDPKYVTHFLEIDRNESELANDVLSTLKIQYDSIDVNELHTLLTTLIKKYDSNLRKVKSAFITAMDKYTHNKKLLEYRGLSFKDYLFLSEILIYIGSISRMTPHQISRINTYSHMSDGIINSVTDNNKLTPEQEEIIIKQAPWAVSKTQVDFAFDAEVSYYMMDKSVKLNDGLIMTIYNLNTNRFAYSDYENAKENFATLALDKEKQNNVMAFFSDKDFAKFIDFLFLKENWEISRMYLDYTMRFPKQSFLYKKWNIISERLFEPQLVDEDKLNKLVSGTLESEWAKRYIENNEEYLLTDTMLRLLYFQKKTKEEAKKVLDEMVRNYPEFTKKIIVSGSVSNRRGYFETINVERFMSATSQTEEEAKEALASLMEKLNVNQDKVLMTSNQNNLRSIDDNDIEFLEYVNHDVSLFRLTPQEKEMERLFPSTPGIVERYYFKFKDNKQKIFFRFTYSDKEIEEVKNTIETSDMFKGKKIIFNKDDVSWFEEEFEVVYD